MEAYFHNIGQPDPPATFQSLWNSLRKTGVVTAGFGNLPGGRGHHVLMRYQSGDLIFAYANGFGVVGYGIAEGPDSYRLRVHARHGHNHRHETGVHWRATAENIGDALRPYDVRAITNHLPRQTSEKIFIQSDKLQRELSRRWPGRKLARSQVVAAFKQLRMEGWPDSRDSTIWDVIDPKTGRRYPPKLILKCATELAGLNAPGKKYPGGGWPTNDILEDLGFVVVPKEGASLAAERDYARLSLAELRRRAKRDERARPTRTQVLSSSVPRSPAISAYAKRLADGICDLCDKDAPFRTRSGPFLESHHIHRLADWGPRLHGERRCTLPQLSQEDAPGADVGRYAEASQEGGGAIVNEPARDRPPPASPAASTTWTRRPTTCRGRSSTGGSRSGRGREATRRRLAAAVAFTGRRGQSL